LHGLIKEKRRKGIGQEKPEKGNGSDTHQTYQDQELSALRDMLLIRRFEEKGRQLTEWARSAVSALYIGQEAIVVGMQMA